MSLVDQTKYPMKTHFPPRVFDSIPSNSIGHEGEVCFVLTTSSYYQKVNGVWTLALLLNAGGGGAGTVKTVNSKSPDTNGAVTVAPSDIGLGNVNNTADSAKPVSTAQANAISAAVSGVTPSSIGLGNVNNTSDAAKPVSTAQAAAIAGITPTSLGLGNVNNTSDASKPVSAPQQTAIAAAVANYRKLIASQGAPTANVTGTSTSTTYPVVAITIPPNSIPGLNGFLEVKARVNVNNSPSVKTIKAVLNNQDLGVTLQMASLTSADLTIRIQNKGATNVQQVTNSSAPNAAPTGTTVDMTVAQNITITCLLGTAGDTCNIGPFSVEASNA